MVMMGPSGSGCHSVVLCLAAVPTLAILRVSALEPVSMLIVSPSVHAGRAPDVDSGVACARRDGQSGVGEAEQIEAAGREFRSGRDLHRREDGLLGRVLGQRPVGEVDVACAGVVELDERVGRVGGRAGMRNSLILTGLTFRTFSAVVSDCFWPVDWFVQEALPIRSPLKAAGPEVTLKVALTLAPGATGSANVFDVSAVPETRRSTAGGHGDAQLDARRGRTRWYW